MIFLRKTEADFLLWCKKLVPKALLDYESFSRKELNVHEERERYDDTLLIKRQLYTLRAIMNVAHRDFFDRHLIGKEPYDNTPVNAELYREIFAAWCKVYFPNGALSEQIIDNAAMGQKLKFLRQEKGLSVDHVASLLGIAKKTLYSYEEGACQVKLEALYRFSLLYDFSIEKLLQSDGIIIKKLKAIHGQPQDQ